MNHTIEQIISPNGNWVAEFEWNGADGSTSIETCPVVAWALVTYPVYSKIHNPIDRKNRALRGLIISESCSSEGVMFADEYIDENVGKFLGYFQVDDSASTLKKAA